MITGTFKFIKMPGRHPDSFVYGLEETRGHDVPQSRIRDLPRNSVVLPVKLDYFCAFAPWRFIFRGT